MSQSNALVEIALALAMAFFSIMVLAMVSMGVPNKNSKINSDFTKPASNAMDIRHSSSSHEANHGETSGLEVRPQEMIIYYKNKFFDANLREVSKEVVFSPTIKYLAVEPNIPAINAANIRKKFHSKTLVVTVLNENWLNELKERSK